MPQVSLFGRIVAGTALAALLLFTQSAVVLADGRYLIVAADPDWDRPVPSNSTGPFWILDRSNGRIEFCMLFRDCKAVGAVSPSPDLNATMTRRARLYGLTVFNKSTGDIWVCSNEVDAGCIKRP